MFSLFFKIEHVVVYLSYCLINRDLGKHLHPLSPILTLLTIYFTLWCQFKFDQV